jgi:hypothetical protein
MKTTSRWAVGGHFGPFACGIKRLLSGNMLKVHNNNCDMNKAGVEAVIDLLSCVCSDCSLRFPRDVHVNSGA